ncbi:hypothetical protein EKO27_g5482 [Xylaria grammica]|uniref:Uncharacterized protein n=1 Tax=Xylaria grammica TaxID=363999 RepID=A0A439D5E7_9PEZI|nr:hypothetical protein EKO27_g5482 [Xylaria grammica]
MLPPGCRWALVKGMRRAADNPQVQELLRQRLKDYAMWASWSPDEKLISKWSSGVISGCRHQLAIILDLEGPDSTGGQHGTLRGACSSHNDSVLSRALKASSRAVDIGEGGAKCLVEYCTSVKCLTEENVGLLESVLELGVSDKIAEAATLFRFPQEYASRPSVNSRISILVSSLYAVQNSHKLQRLFGEGLVVRSHETLRDAQNKCFGELKTGDLNNRVASGIIKLSRSLVSAHWLTRYWTTEYSEMLNQIPSELEVQRRFRQISRTEGREKQEQVEFLIERSCAGPHASTASHGGSHSYVQSEDPIWSFPMDADRERLRCILSGLEWIDAVAATACVKRAEMEEDRFIQSLNMVISEDTDQVCVNLARLFGPLALKAGKLDPCWKALLLGMMRAKPKGLLDRLGESLTLQSWQDWLKCSQGIFGEGHLDPEGQLGFTKPQIRKWQFRKMSLARAESGASTATRSTSGRSNGSDFALHHPRLSRDNSPCELDTPLTIPTVAGSEDQPNPFPDPYENQNIWSDTGCQGDPDFGTSIGNSENNTPWYEHNTEFFNA